MRAMWKPVVRLDAKHTICVAIMHSWCTAEKFDT